MIRHKIGGHGGQCERWNRTLVDQHHYGAYAANRSTSNRAGTFVYMDGPSDGRGTSQDTAASDTVQAQQSPSPPFCQFIQSRFNHYHLTMGGSKVQGVCVCVRVRVRVRVHVRVCVHVCVCVLACD